MLGWKHIFVMVLLSSISEPLFAQFSYKFNQDITVVNDSEVQSMPWTGGLNLAQYNSMDINNDGIADLLIYDRHSRKPFCFISDGTQFSYAPEFEHFFPAELDHWVLLRDYNCDGKKDLFTASLFGMSLFENVGEKNGNPAFELKYSTVYTEGNSGQINLQVNKGDLPGIQDIDGDGDLDILVYDFASGGGIQLHKNMSVERTGNCGLDLVLETEVYGNFMECTCEDYVFGGEQCPDGGRLEHAGGKSILSFNFSDPMAQDLVIGQEDCTNFGYLPNSGTPETAEMLSVDFTFPDIANITTLNYPAAFKLDLDFDGTDDLLLTHNIFAAFDNPEYSANNWLFKGNGSGYSLTSKNFMQNQMIEVGHGAAPSFFDFDADGDEDLIIGSENLSSAAALFFYRNSGDALNPELQLEDEDYLSLTTEGWDKVAPQIIDINNDNRKDLVINYGDGDRMVRVYLNTGNTFLPFSESNFISLQMPTFGVNDNLHFYFSLGKTGVLVARETGGLVQYINQGSINNPIWELISDAYLGIIDDFTARNLAVYIEDIDLDGKADLIRYDDSGVLRIYSDIRGEPMVFEELLQDQTTFLGYNSSFGRNGIPSVTKITGAERPSIAIGTIGGGLQLLTNVEDDEQNIDVPVRIASFPNPLNRSENLSILINKDTNVRILNSQGQVFIEKLEVVKNQQVFFDLRGFRAGLYLIEAIDDAGDKAVSRVVITE